MDRKKRISAAVVFPEARLMNSVNIPTTDPQGSYTGQPADSRDHPVQDADDL